MGDHVEALSCQQKAVLMSERVNGLEHPYTITEYTHLALYCFANTQVGSSTVVYSTVYTIDGDRNYSAKYTNIITEYTYLALYCFANTQVSSSTVQCTPY